MITQEQRTPDLLRRFVATPHKLSFALGPAFLTLETNDSSLIADMQRECIANVNVASEQSLRIKVIRDDEAPSDNSDVLLLRSLKVNTLLVGTGTILAFDTERHEIVGFLDPFITAGRLLRELLPMLLNQRCPGSSQDQKPANGTM